MKYFIEELRKLYKIPRYCWKLEFHEADENAEVWPHWHLLLDYKRKIRWEDVQKCWGLGRVNVKAVTNARFEYLFKYVSKALDELPYWFAGMIRPRCWQTSMNFYSGFADNTAGESKKQASPRPVREDRADDTKNETSLSQRETLGERLGRWSRSCIVRSISRSGKPLHRVAELEKDWGYAAATFARHLLSGTLREASNNISLNYIKTSCLHLLPIKDPHLLLN